MDPVIAGDGYSYERQARFPCLLSTCWSYFDEVAEQVECCCCRKPIEQWLDSGHNTSPMTGGRMPQETLTPNHALRSAIQQWQGR